MRSFIISTACLFIATTWTSLLHAAPSSTKTKQPSYEEQTAQLGRLIRVYQTAENRRMVQSTVTKSPSKVTKHLPTALFQKLHKQQKQTHRAWYRLPDMARGKEVRLKGKTWQIIRHHVGTAPVWYVYNSEKDALFMVQKTHRGSVVRWRVVRLRPLAKTLDQIVARTRGKQPGQQIRLRIPTKASQQPIAWTSIPKLQDRHIAKLLYRASMAYHKRKQPKNEKCSIHHQRRWFSFQRYGAGYAVARYGGAFQLTTIRKQRWHIMIQAYHKGNLAYLYHSKSGTLHRADVNLNTHTMTIAGPFKLSPQS